MIDDVGEVNQLLINTFAEVMNTFVQFLMNTFIQLHSNCIMIYIKQKIFSAD